MAVQIICNGTVTVAADNSPQCSTGDWELVTYQPSFDPSQLDPVLIAGAVGFGFFVLLPLWAAAYGVKKLIHALPG